MAQTGGSSPTRTFSGPTASPSITPAVAFTGWTPSITSSREPTWMDATARPSSVKAFPIPSLSQFSRTASTGPTGTPRASTVPTNSLAKTRRSFAISSTFPWISTLFTRKGSPQAAEIAVDPTTETAATFVSPATRPTRAPVPPALKKWTTTTAPTDGHPTNQLRHRGHVR